MPPELAALIAGAHHILVFSGAGLSTGSGIPDFRGPRGIWKQRQPVYYDEFLASHGKRVEYWEYKVEGMPAFLRAAPNAAHDAIVALERAGRLDAIVTQNIDGLHQLAGSSQGRVIEIHGTNRRVECVRCGEEREPAAAIAAFERDRQPPTCACGGWLKFATISFGQPLREAVLARACAAAERADLVLALGSTLSVQPAASIPLIAARAGAPYIIINQGPTDHDSIATLRLEGDVAALLPAAVRDLA
jgi:NAD-dependent deacetylase